MLLPHDKERIMHRLPHSLSGFGEMENYPSTKKLGPCLGCSVPKPSVLG